VHAWRKHPAPKLILLQTSGSQTKSTGQGGRVELIGPTRVANTEHDGLVSLGTEPELC